MHATGYSVSGLTIPSTIATGGSITVSVKFAPTTTGLSSGYILFTSNATNSSAQYSVSGTGFKLSGITVPLTLAAAQTKNFTVAFAPTASGSVTGSVTIGSNGTNPSYKLALSGTGGTATRTISLSTSSLNFGNEVVGGTSQLGVAVKNTGNSSLSISAINVTGSGFSVGSGIAGTTVAAGQTAELNVAFAPKATGSVSGTVSVVSSATNSPNGIAVSGTGVSNTSHSVSLSWNASSTSGVVGYYVYRSTVSGSSYTRLTSSAVGALKYTDGTVSTGKTYYYVVTAVGSGGTESAHSTQVNAIIP